MMCWTFTPAHDIARCRMSGKTKAQYPASVLQSPTARMAIPPPTARCVHVVRTSWQGGPRAAPPLHPPAPVAVGRALNRSLRPSNRIAGSSLAGRRRSPCTHRPGRRSCPQGPLTISWRPGRELSRSLALEPSHRPRAHRPLEPRPTLRGLDAVSASTLNPIKGLSRPLKPTRRAGDPPLHLHSAMHDRLPAQPALWRSLRPSPKRTNPE